MMVIIVMFSIRNLTAAQAADLHAALSSLPKSFSSQMSQYAAAAQLSGKTKDIFRIYQISIFYPLLLRSGRLGLLL